MWLDNTNNSNSNGLLFTAVGSLLTVIFLVYIHPILDIMFAKYTNKTTLETSKMQIEINKLQVEANEVIQGFEKVDDTHRIGFQVSDDYVEEDYDC